MLFLLYNSGGEKEEERVGGGERERERERERGRGERKNCEFLQTEVVAGQQASDASQLI